MKYQIVLVGSLLASITATEAHGGAEPSAPHAAPQAHAASPQMHMAAPAMHAAPQMHMAAAPPMRAPQMHMAAPAIHTHPQMRMEASSMHAPSQMHAGEPRIHEAATTVHAASETHMASSNHSHAPTHAAAPQMHGGAANRMHEAAAPATHEARNQEPGAARVHEAEAGREPGREAGRAAGHEGTQAGAHEVGGPAGRQAATIHGMQAGRGNLVAAPHAFSNPRRVGNIGKTPHTVARATKTLPWARGAAIPRAGAKGIGRPGAIDPGGYIRSARGTSQVINNGYMHQQLAAMAGFNATLANNNRFRVGNWNQWPGHWRPGPGWANLGYYPNYWWNGNVYPGAYFAADGFCPTPYLFDVGCGQFWQPGAGYFDYLPNGYNAPITVSVMEVVPEYDAWGNIVGYHPHRFRYNAFWDPNAQAYGYYDYRGAFQWVTFPGLNSWTGSEMTNDY